MFTFFANVSQASETRQGPLSRAAQADRLLPSAEQTLADLAAAPIDPELKEYLARELRCTIAVCKEAHLPTQDDKAAARELRSMAIAVAQMNAEIARADAKFGEGYKAGVNARPALQAAATA